MFQYLPFIVNALEHLYTNDGELFDGKVHEQSFSFRIAFYLGQELEHAPNGLHIDCEYHRNKNSAKEKKYLEHYGFFRPDIIYHDRDRDNEFCIEIKKRGLIKTNHNGHIVCDKDKIEGMINEYGYKEGFCIYNLGKSSVTVWCKSYGQEETKHYVWENQHLIEDEN